MSNYLLNPLHEKTFTSLNKSKAKFFISRPTSYLFFFVIDPSRYNPIYPWYKLEDHPWHLSPSPRHPISQQVLFIFTPKSFTNKSLIFYLSDCWSYSGPPSFKELSHITSQFNVTRVEDRTGHSCLSLHPAYQVQCPVLGWHSGNVCWMNEWIAPYCLQNTTSGVLSPHRVSPHNPPPGDHSSTCF